ncbi:MAG: FtsX-like permease family protein [Massiliimalia sp.]|jgi:putative ABC transport system permease protein
MARPTAFMKDIFREIWKTRNRFLSIFAIIALGTGFFAGIKATCPDMKLTASQYYEDSNLMDIKLVSTLGFTEDDVKAIEQREDVDQVLPAYSVDLIANQGDEDEALIKVMSWTEEDPLNHPTLIEGRMPESSGECVIDENAQGFNHFSIGDTITLSSEDADNPVSDSLTTDTFTVVGIVRSPLYINLERGTTTIGNGSLDGFILVPEQDFSYEAYTDVFLSLTDTKGLDPFDEEYTDLIEEKTEELETFSKERAQIRYDEIYDDARQELDEAQAKLDDAQAEFDEQITSAQQQLDDAKQELEQGQKELDEQKQQFESTVSQTQKQLTDGQNQLNAAQAELNQKKQEYDASYASAKEQIDQGYAQLNAAQQQLDAQKQAAGENPSAEIQAQLDAAQQQLDQQKAQLDEQSAQLTSAQQQLQEAQAQITAQQTQLNEQKASFESQTAQAPEQFAKAQQEIDDGWAEYEDGLSELEQQKAEGQQEIDDAKAEIADGEKQLSDLSEPKWYVFDRTFYPGYDDYGTDAERVDNVAKVFPLFFVLVALLVCLTTMTRMVEEHRTQIGTLKALGYSRNAIVSKYMIYSILASVLGSAVGITLCSKLFPTVIFNAYRIIYCNLPDIEAPIRWTYAIGCTAVAVACTTLAAYLSCYAELFSQPAQLMRPKAPPAGKRILLERWGWFWNKLSFIYKVTFRNIFRYKKRVLMTIVGIAGCTALMLTGFGLQNAIASMVPKQFDEIFVYDTMVILEDGLDDQQVKEMEQNISDMDSIDSCMLVDSRTVDISSSESTQSVSLFVPEYPENMDDYIVLKKRTDQQSLSMDTQGVILTEKLAKLLDVSAGDTVTITREEGDPVSVTVSAVAENYVMHYIYMSPELYENLFGTAPEYNTVMANIEGENTQAVRDDLSEELISDSNILAVSFSSDMSGQFKDIVSNLNYIVLVTIVSAGALAFIVLYNLVNVNVAERTRELATIKVLGFFDQEVSAYIYRENIFCTFFGIALGLFLGIFLERFVVTTAEVDMVMFTPTINFMSYFYASVLTLAFTLIVNVVLHFKLKKLDMVESLKSIE